jgi:hypothetical protein
MPAPRYGLAAPSVSLTGATAKTVIGAKAHANSGLLLLGYSLGFDGVSASAVPGLVEICYCTWATNSPGTASTSITPAQTLGRTLTAGFTAGYNWTTEPTALTVLRRYNTSPNSATILWEWPLGTEPDCALAEGFAIRCTFPASVGVVATLDVARC